MNSLEIMKNVFVKDLRSLVSLYSLRHQTLTMMAFRKKSINNYFLFSLEVVSLAYTTHRRLVLVGTLYEACGNDTRRRYY